jgi:hypothetical protein
MRRATGLSSSSSCLWAFGETSTFQAIAAHYFFEGNRLAATGADFCQCLLREVDVFQVVQILQDGFTGVVSLGASGAFGEAFEAFFDGFGKADCYTIIADQRATLMWRNLEDGR